MVVAQQVRTFRDCTSTVEKKQRFGVYFVSLILILLWIVGAIFTMGGLALLTLLGWAISHLTAEYNVRKLQAMGATVSERQFPQIFAAARDVAQRFEVKHAYKIVVLEQSSVNAMAIRFARKHVIVLFSELVEGMYNHPAQLRALLAHEMCHMVLGDGFRGNVLELYQPARFKQGRELTCDHAACVAAASISETRTMLKKVAVGNRLYPVLSEPELLVEAKHIESGLVGWFIKQKLTHPPVGTRLASVSAFGASAGVPEAAPAQLAAAAGAVAAPPQQPQRRVAATPATAGGNSPEIGLQASGAKL